MTDQELIEKIVNDQVSSIRLQRLYRDNPLACPPPIKGHKEEIDRLWAEAIEKELYEKISYIVAERCELLDKLEGEVFPINFNNYTLSFGCMRYEGE